MKKYSMHRLAILLIILAGLTVPSRTWAQEAKAEKVGTSEEAGKTGTKADDIEHCKEIKAKFIKTDGMLKNLFDNSAGYVIFPNIGKGAMGVGGATGNGIVFEKGKPIGKANMTQLTIGAQAGAKVYSEVIFFETAEALKSLTDGKFEFAGQVSAVAVKAGVSANIKYREGVLVFTQERGGLMYEASVGGQKFSYTAY